MNKFYIYAYLREDRTPYYVGKGSGVRAFKRNPNERFQAPNASRILLLDTNLTEKEAFYAEQRYIGRYGRKDNGTGILRNLTDGGEGNSGFIMSESTKAKMRKPKSLETRKKMCKPKSEAHKKKLLEHLAKCRKTTFGPNFHTHETKRKIAEANSKRVWKQESRDKLSASRIKLRYDPVTGDDI